MDSKNLASGQWPNKPRETALSPADLTRIVRYRVTELSSRELLLYTTVRRGHSQ